jgi:hypothetical protein
MLRAEFPADRREFASLEKALGGDEVPMLDARHRSADRQEFGP